jgi:hypothetical protein
MSTTNSESIEDSKTAILELGGVGGCRLARNPRIRCPYIMMVLRETTAGAILVRIKAQ